MVEDVADGGGEAGEQGIEIVVDLIAKRRRSCAPGRGGGGPAAGVGHGSDRRRLDQAEAVDGGALDGGEVGVVGLVAGIGRESELLGGQGMDDPGLEAGVGEGAADGWW